MEAIKMSELCYKEFVQYLEENKIDTKTLRVFLAGQGWGGPVFNLALDEQKEDDVVTTINDLTFLMEKDLVDATEGVTIKCAEENQRGGFSVEPNNAPTGGGCSSCSSCG